MRYQCVQRGVVQETKDVKEDVSKEGPAVYRDQ